ncbi:hypothetical protein M0802_011933 [Mischocyttarus mexicanus]|nr:hypothetical protein M0802_011933 [Mischocyttarus mexicanus]
MGQLYVYHKWYRPSRGTALNVPSMVHAGGNVFSLSHILDQDMKTSVMPPPRQTVTSSRHEHSTNNNKRARIEDDNNNVPPRNGVFETVNRYSILN